MTLKTWPLFCKSYSKNILFWIMFVYYPDRAALTPAMLRPEGRREIRTALLALADRLASTLVFVAVDMHFAVAGRFDDVSFVAHRRLYAGEPKPWIARAAGALER